MDIGATYWDLKYMEKAQYGEMITNSVLDSFSLVRDILSRQIKYGLELWKEF